MKSFFPVLLLLLLTSSATSFAQTTPKESFSSFLASFNQALEKNEKEKVADLCSFPAFNWEKGLGVDVKREVFLKNFEKIFTPNIRTKLKSAKFVASGRNYTTDWIQNGNSYSLWFNGELDGTFRFAGLYIGPPP